MIGDIYGDFQIIRYTNERNKSRQIICEGKCVKCGNIKLQPEYEFKRNNYKHSIDNCKEQVIKQEIGKVYGDYTIIDFVGSKSKCYVYRTKCNICSRERDRYIKDLRKGIANTHKSCSLLLPKDKNTKRLRDIWSHMVDRCTNPNCEKYHCYGGRGITCDYEYFIDFYDDMYESYIEHVNLYGVKQTTLDRIDVNKNYTKDNLRWATWETQLQNKRKTIFKATNGKETFIGGAREVAKFLECDSSIIYDRVNKNMDKDIKGFKIELVEQ